MTTAMKTAEQLLSEWSEEKARVLALADELTDSSLTARERDRTLDAFMAQLTDRQIRRSLRHALELLVTARRGR